MDSLTKGTWIINSGKHLLGVRQNTPELSYFEATETSSKAAMLLARLVAEEHEEIPMERVRVFARESGLAGPALLPTLKDLEDLGKISFNKDSAGRPISVEVYAFSLSEAIQAATAIFDRVGPTAHEEATLVALDSTFQLPRYEEELLEAVVNSGLSEDVAVQALKLQETFELVRVSNENEGSIYYNEYAFSGNATKVVRALDALSEPERQAVVDIQELVQSYPGFSLERLKERFPAKIVSMMEGVGLIDVMNVESNVGSGSFVTLPQMQGVAIRTPLISVDVFHKAKLLLSSLRFGEYKSHSGRGKIGSFEKMVNIVKKLNRGEWVGPCRAIGQDYQLLERDGVIATKPYKQGMYYMKLRQMEVGRLVGQLLEYKRIVPELEVDASGYLVEQPNSYVIPEQRRSQILANPSKPVKELRERLLQSIRTGMR